MPPFSVAPCPACVTERGCVDDTCGTCRGSGRRPIGPPRGRPPVTGTTRAKSLLLRVTEEEREALRDAAKREALPLGAWARSILLRAARR